MCWFFSLIAEYSWTRRPWKLLKHLLNMAPLFTNWLACRTRIIFVREAFLSSFCLLRNVFHHIHNSIMHSKSQDLSIHFCNYLFLSFLALLTQNRNFFWKFGVFYSLPHPRMRRLQFFSTHFLICSLSALNTSQSQDFIPSTSRENYNIRKMVVLGFLPNFSISVWKKSHNLRSLKCPLISF